MNYSRDSRMFSLLELILVMVVLAAIVSLTLPRLSGFFEGRKLDSEARRLWALSRQAQSTAISRGQPMQLWYDQDSGNYGLEAVPGFGFEIQGSSYSLPGQLTIAPEENQRQGDELTMIWWPDGTVENGDNGWQITSTRLGGQGWVLRQREHLATMTLEKLEVVR